jgi:class 3 adenylate cyclase
MIFFARFPWLWRQLIVRFENLLIIILLIASGVSALTGGMASFVVIAVRDAETRQARLRHPQAHRSGEADRLSQTRRGVHLGDVVEESDGDLMGDGVNIAARLEGIAEPGAICLSEQAYWQVKGRLDLARDRPRRDAAQEHRRAGAGLFVTSRRPSGR